MAAFTYFNNIPQATDTLSSSQPDILTNFASIQSFVDVDHVDFSSMTAGQHNQVSLPLNAGYPVAPTFAPGTIGLFNFTSPISGINELYITKNINGGGQDTFPLTDSIFSNTALPTAGADWFSYLPSGILMKGGGLASTGSSPFLFPVAANIPVFTQIFTVLVSVNAASGMNGYVSLNAITTAGFDFTLSTDFPAGATLQYLAVGY